MFRKIFQLNHNQFSNAIKVAYNNRQISLASYLRNNNCAERSGEIDFCIEANTSINNKSSSLSWNFAPVDIDYEKRDDFDEKPGLTDDNDVNFERQKKYEGEYKFNGIKVFVPQSKMLLGTLRNKAILPDDMPDDHRIISFHKRKRF